MKFLLLTSPDGTSCLVNMEYIVFVYREGDTTDITVLSDTEENDYLVRERPGQVWEMMAGKGWS